MSENKNLETTLVEDPETEETTLETVVEELTETVFQGSETITPYKVWKVTMGTLEAMGSTKTVPSQMMYNYDRNGLIVKGKKGVKSYNKDEVKTFVTKYVQKHI